jgi:hypothetical protein
MENCLPDRDCLYDRDDHHLYGLLSCRDWSVRQGLQKNSQVITWLFSLILNQMGGPSIENEYTHSR